MLAVEACVSALKDMSRTVTTPEEIAQVCCCFHYLGICFCSQPNFLSMKAHELFSGKNFGICLSMCFFEYCYQPCAKYLDYVFEFIQNGVVFYINDISDAA